MLHSSSDTERLEDQVLGSSALEEYFSFSRDLELYRGTVITDPVDRAEFDKLWGLSKSGSLISGDESEENSWLLRCFKANDDVQSLIVEDLKQTRKAAFKEIQELSDFSVTDTER